jgi:hypothetical protein
MDKHQASGCLEGAARTAGLGHQAHETRALQPRAAGYASPLNISRRHLRLTSLLMLSLYESRPN